MKDIRQSNFEILRLIAIFMIVLYHLFYQIVCMETSMALYKAVQMPLHIGVILFVLISGWFNIKFSFRGLFKIAAQMMVLYLPLLIVFKIHICHETAKEVMPSLLFISRTPLWYIRTYLCLFLMSPFVNICLKNINNKERIWLLLSLTFISSYLGLVSTDTALVESDGKNIINFILIYAIGDTLHKYKETIDSIPQKCIWVIYILINIGEVTLYMASHDMMLGNVVFKLGYAYNSPLLILNAVLLFIAASRWNIQSKTINTLASSVLVIYLLQESPFLLWGPIYKIVHAMIEYNHQAYMLIPALLMLTASMCGLFISVDKIFSPVWKLAEQTGKKIDSYINR